MTHAPYPRDMIGYGPTPPQANWPGKARLAVQFVLNYEEGGERTILHGDQEAEMFLSEIVSAPHIENARHMSMESLYEYGSRVGVWRLFDLFRSYDIPLTLFAVAMAMERNPAVVEAALKDGHELCSHGYRWIDYQTMPEEQEREHLERAIEIHRRLTGARPLGWYTGRTGPNTRRLVAENGGFLYDADDYNDDLPFWTYPVRKPHLVVPYTLDVNDMRFATVQGFNCGDQFFSYLKDSFDTLYAEGAHTPRMLSVGLHCRIAGKPGRIAALRRFLDYIRGFDDIWLCRRIDIARHWRQMHPAPNPTGETAP
ncbi:chitin deacetylase [Iodidimonas gelatinilytica]|uniref:Chitooligosaccharide deacetylase n=2 Tax=Iodidimonas gelatinilytica TaxID=1236966 RepID=A0A5A7MT37_9PROT|nr:allantoinase PuuE [Iodidimonas gelatinilytica]GEQ98413.1 chitin deacetylase [Iodidimonas gelatinilytica]